MAHIREVTHNPSASAATEFQSGSYVATISIDREEDWSKQAVGLEELIVHELGHLTVAYASGLWGILSKAPDIQIQAILLEAEEVVVNTIVALVWAAYGEKEGFDTDDGEEDVLCR